MYTELFTEEPSFIDCSKVAVMQRDLEVMQYWQVEM